MKQQRFAPGDDRLMLVLETLGDVLAELWSCRTEVATVFAQLGDEARAAGMIQTVELVEEAIAIRLGLMEELPPDPT